MFLKRWFTGAFSYQILKTILNPSFEEVVLKGDFNFKGKIRIGTVLYQVIRVLLDENCKRFYKIVKKEIKNGR